MKIFHVVSWNKSVVYLLSFTKECILDLLTLFYDRLIKTISCFAGKQLWKCLADLMDKIYQSSSIYCSKFINKVKVSERMTEWRNDRMTDRKKKQYDTRSSISGE